MLRNIIPVDRLVPFNSVLVHATKTLTWDEDGGPDADDVVTIGLREYTLVAALTEAVAAAALLTSDEDDIVEGDQIQVGTQTYTFVLQFSPTHPRSRTPNEVLIHEDDPDETLENLAHALNLTHGKEGVAYSFGTKINTLVEGGAVDPVEGGFTLALEAREAGEAGNDIDLVFTATDEEEVHLEVTDAFADGVSEVADEVLVGAGGDETLANLAAAINGGEGAGTLYSNPTTPHEQVTSGAVAAHAITVTAKQGGVAGNSIVVAEDGDDISWGEGGTLAGGGGTAGKLVIGKNGGVARRFIVAIPDLTGTPTVNISLYSKDGVLIKALQATAAENSSSDTAYEINLDPGDYITLTATGTVSDLSVARVMIR